MSALVTLFANILQNPQDVRARSDLKLMASVVSFLTMLERDASESNGNVRRMLSVCSEFERIAGVVLDKAERDMRSKGGKRKAGSGQTQKEQGRAMRDQNAIDAVIAAGLEEGKTLEQIQAETQAAYRRPIQTPSLRSAQNSGAGASPISWGGSQGSGHDQGVTSPSQRQQRERNHPAPMQNMMGQWNEQNAAMAGFGIPGGMTGPVPNELANGNMQPPPGNFNQPQQGLADGFNSNSSAAFSSANMDPLMAGEMGLNGDMGVGGSFQQPFVPQDLWQMPMTLEWDWAEGLGLGSFTPGSLNSLDAGGYMPDQAGGNGGQGQ